MAGDAGEAAEAAEAGDAGDAGEACKDADPGKATGKATSKLLAKAAVAAGEGILGMNAETVLTSQ